MSTSITVDGVSRTYPGRGRAESVVALQDASFDVAAGEFVALIGPSGCGKSTVLRAIAGLDTKYDGEIRLGHRLVTGPSVSVGMVFQEHRLLPWLTVRENILFGYKGSNPRGRSDDLLELMHLEGFADAHPHQLSGGMAQRAAIARALAPRPDVLLLDEPFGALDAFTRIEMQDLLRDIWRQHNTTALLVTHDVDEAIVLADRVVVMAPRPGRIKHIHDVDLPFPRNRTSEQFSRVRAELMTEFSLVH